ncbi:MAG: hypothetical protein OYI31_01565 [Chloroflexota bacterium]|nr:hypothetical protein [Chloroflexota bacterium]MDE2941684.1 hypothetical protein [Chloroflexota bacterium]MDE3267135.1 hypothetical protein [Chloroflexota bacterium]
MHVFWAVLRYAAFALVALLLLTGRGALNFSPVDELAASHRYSLVQWELATFPEKWLYRLGLMLPGNSLDRKAEEELVREFFELADRRRGLEEAIRVARAGAETGNLDSLRAQLAAVEADQAAIRNRVEEIMEGEIDSIVFEEGLHVGGPLSAFGVHFPPVDFRVQASPPVTIVSPRDRIERLEDVLLRPDTAVEDREVLEEAVLDERNQSALVISTGGVATVPAVISPNFSMHGTLVTAAHEWMHHYLFFFPLGQGYGRNAELTTLNETVANIVGAEVGKLAYERFRLRQEDTPPTPEETPPPPEEKPFDFRAEMRATRLRTEELLAAGLIDEAERYMEERRLFLADNGYYIRKLNQAYFAFHGSYADSAASISPIDGQLRAIREASDSLGDFVRTVASVSSHDEFLKLLAELGIES